MKILLFVLTSVVAIFLVTEIVSSSSDDTLTPEAMLHQSTAFSLFN
ncbi:hypothetical protein GT360_06175 [Vibrio astriarenae]|uniref:Uncharacterized protein n=1 Tax=Vibrio astriarenae TaxID=1481923 RepID=A0A7Z2YD90_9VIBR|nr:hypothetical protein [Vibrio astriarenae]QIA63121.1 hypothetical protein GT360_06175 [Vibrio astriarenae]